MIEEYTSRNGDKIVKLDCDTEGCDNVVRMINPSPFSSDNPAEGWRSIQVKRENEETGEEEVEILEVLCPRHADEAFG